MEIKNFFLIFSTLPPDGISISDPNLLKEVIFKNCIIKK